MFGGKGGVGKTTCAAALAIDGAGVDRRRVLLLSTDPAHSLGDVLGRLSDDPAAVHGGPPNLTVRELDAAARFAALRERFARGDRGAVRRLAGRRSDAGHDRQVMHDLIDLAPPGIDELAAVIEVTERSMRTPVRPTFDLIVMDTAPSGHALRLLEMPALVHDWVKALMSILLKYQPVVGVGELGAVLLDCRRARTVARAAGRTRREPVRRRHAGRGAAARGNGAPAGAAGRRRHRRADRGRQRGRRRHVPALPAEDARRRQGDMPRWPWACRQFVAATAPADSGAGDAAAAVRMARSAAVLRRVASARRRR